MSFIKDKGIFLLSWLGVITFLFWTFGCEPTTVSLIDPLQKVTWNELEYEIDSLLKKSELRFTDLQKKYELRDMILNQSVIIAQSGSINPLAIMTSALAIAGLGAGADDLRLRKKIKRDNKNK